MPLTFTELDIPGLVLVTSKAMGDDRGAFFESYKSSDFEAAGLPSQFKQDNQSRSIPGVLRGVHFQRDPHAQGKLVSVAQGKVFDVGVDLRRGSPTYAQWAAVTLCAGDGQALYIPPGFGHGFCVLGDVDAVLTYKCTAEYSHPHDGGVRWDDPQVGIEWPIDGEPLLSPKDQAQPLLADCDHGFTYESPPVE